MGRETPEKAHDATADAADLQEEETSSLERAGEDEEAIERRLG